MVCHVDGTDYIPLLSVTPTKIIFSGIYNTTSVSLDFDTDGTGTLTSTYLAQSSAIKSYNWDAAYTHSQSTHAPTDAQPNQNAFGSIYFN